MDKRSRSDVAPTLSPANGPPDHETTGSRGVSPTRDPVTPFVHAVIALFRGPLADVRFPDADRASLESLANAACESQCEVEVLEAALEAARSRTRAAQDTLGEHATRALAYARVFSHGQPELEDAIASLPMRGELRDREPKSASSSGTIEGEQPKRRGRPRKTPLDRDSSEPLLPMHDVAMDEPVEAAVGAAE